MEAAVITLVVGASVVLVVWLVRHSHKHEAAVTAAWTEFARRNGYRWIEASGPWYRRVQAHVLGERDGIALVLERFWVSNGKSSTVYTRVRATLRHAPGETLLVRRNTWLNRAGTFFSPPRVDTGHASFDECWLVRCKSAEVARELIDARARELLLHFQPPGQLEVRGRKLALQWHGSEMSARVLDSALNVVAAVAGAATRR